MAVVTGTRAEYGLLTSTLRAIHAHPRLELQVVVAGIHLLARFGRTVRHIERDGWPIVARVRMQSGDDSPTDQAEGLARGVAGIARALERARSDRVLVLGDRIEALAGALAAVTTGRLLAHVHGGDVAPGDFDDSLRHAITKLAHLHLAATRDAARRIVRLGEDPHRVHVVGAPGLDELREVMERRTKPPCANTRRERARLLPNRGLLGGPRSPCAPSNRARRSGARSHPPEDAGERPTALVIYHAWGRPAAVERRTMEHVLTATAERGLRRVILFPNTDRGHTGVLEAIARHQRASAAEDVRVERSLARDEYLRALLDAAVLIGNSSSGIIEAPFAGTPSVNVGGRQAGRLGGGPSIVHVGEDLSAIRRGLARALRLRPRAGGRTPYGDGRAGRRIARLLASLQTRGLLTKTITY